MKWYVLRSGYLLCNSIRLGSLLWAPPPDRKPQEDPALLNTTENKVH